MKTPITRHALGAALAAALLAGAANAGPPQWQIRYKIEFLSGLGGSATSGNSINDLGWIAGQSNLTDDAASEAVLWRGQQRKPLGTLGGANSAVLWPVKNVLGIVSGIAQTGEDDPNDEIWSCGYFFPGDAAVGNRCLGFRWQNGRMTALKPFAGGTHSFATGTNNLGQTVGWAENGVRDPECNSPQVLQFRAALWGAGKDQPRELPPLAGDGVSSATAINDRGQVVGISGACSNAVGGLSAKRNVLWENGVAKNIGDFGGIAWNTPMMINQRGDVVGFANISAEVGTSFRPRAFLWTRSGGIQRLDLLPVHDADGKGRGQALGINEWRQVVGQSCNSAGGDCRAVIWRDGTPADLNAVASSLGTAVLVSANDIDNLGRITGVAADGGKSMAFEATPYLSAGR